SFAAGIGYRAVLRYQGPSGRTPGAFIDTFVPPGSGGLITPNGLLFGPDGNGDGRQDLYVSSVDFNGPLLGTGNSIEVICYDGVTGVYLDTFIRRGDGGLDDPLFMTFTETDPTTLAYTGATTRAATAALPALSAIARTAAHEVHGGGQAVLSDPTGNAFSL